MRVLPTSCKGVQEACIGRATRFAHCMNSNEHKGDDSGCKTGPDTSVFP